MAGWVRVSTLSDRWGIKKQAIHQRAKRQGVGVVRSGQTFIPREVAKDWENEIVAELKDKMQRLRAIARNITAGPIPNEEA